MARNANLTFNVCFAGPVGILSPVDTGYGSGDGKVALSVDDPGHACIESGKNELQDNGNCFMFAVCDEKLWGSTVLQQGSIFRRNVNQANPLHLEESSWKFS